MTKPQYVPPGYNPITDELPPMGPSCVSYLITGAVVICVGFFVLGGLASMFRRPPTNSMPTIAVLPTDTATLPPTATFTPSATNTGTVTEIVPTLPSETATEVVASTVVDLPLETPTFQVTISRIEPTYYAGAMTGVWMTETALHTTPTLVPPKPDATRRPSTGNTRSGGGGSGGSGNSSGGASNGAAPSNPTPQTIWITVWPDAIPATEQPPMPTNTPTPGMICWGTAGSTEQLCATWTPTGDVNALTPTTQYVGSPTSTSSPTSEPTATQTYMDAATATPTSTETGTPTPTHTPTYTSTFTQTPTPTATETPTMTATGLLP
jgi:hypothetical protein